MFYFFGVVCPEMSGFVRAKNAAGQTSQGGRSPLAVRMSGWLAGCRAMLQGWQESRGQAWPGKAGLALAQPSPRQGPRLAYPAGLAVIPPPRAPCPPAGRYGPALPRRLAAHCPACRGLGSPSGCACLDPAPNLSCYAIDPSMLLPDPRITSITGNRAALR